MIFVTLLQVFTLQLSVQFVRCAVLRGLGLIFRREGGLATLYNFPLSSRYLFSCGQCESCFPFFLDLKEINSNLNFNAEVLNCFKTWEAVSLGSNFSSWISWRVSLCLTRPPNSPSVKWQHQETWVVFTSFWSSVPMASSKGKSFGTEEGSQPLPLWFESKDNATLASLHSKGRLSWYKTVEFENLCAP